MIREESTGRKGEEYGGIELKALKEEGGRETEGREGKMRKKRKK